MNQLSLNLYICGMNEETFSTQIMIYKPFDSFMASFTDEELTGLHIIRVGELIEYIKNTNREAKEKLKIWGI